MTGVPQGYNAVVLVPVHRRLSWAPVHHLGGTSHGSSQLLAMCSLYVIPQMCSRRAGVWPAQGSLVPSLPPGSVPQPVAVFKQQG